MSKTLTMAKVTYGQAIKSVILLILLVVFFILFFWQVVVQYSEKITNTTKKTLKAETIEAPTFTICSGWKESLFEEYKISPVFFILPSVSDTNLPSNATLRTIFDELTFKLNKDFIIQISPNYILEPTLLKLGMNEIKMENSIYKFEVEEITTQKSGLCYVIIPMGISLKPYKESMFIGIARNETAENIEMTKVDIQISSNDTYLTFDHKASGMKNRIIEQDFTSNLTSLGIHYTEENTEFIKDCSDSSYFKRLANKLEETEKFNCTKKCIPLMYDSLMNVINHNIPKCTDPIKNNECMLGMKGFDTTLELKSTCIKQCKFKGATLDLQLIKQKPFLPLGTDMNSFVYPYGENINIHSAIIRVSIL